MRTTMSPSPTRPPGLAANRPLTWDGVRGVGQREPRRVIDSATLSVAPERIV